MLLVDRIIAVCGDTEVDEARAWADEIAARSLDTAISRICDDTLLVYGYCAVCDPYQKFEVEGADLR